MKKGKIYKVSDDKEYKILMVDNARNQVHYEKRVYPRTNDRWQFEAASITYHTCNSIDDFKERVNAN